MKYKELSNDFLVLNFTLCNHVHVMNEIQPLMVEHSF